jgi:hypothetical protein
VKEGEGEEVVSEGLEALLRIGVTKCGFSSLFALLAYRDSGVWPRMSIGDGDGADV